MQIRGRLEMSDIQKIMRSRGIEENGKVQKYIDERVLVLCDPYLPFDSSVLKKSGVTGTVAGSGKVCYNAPYAKFLYYGKVMVSPSTGSPWAKKNEKKVKTNRDLRFNGGGLRGAFWFERMKADKLDSLANEIGQIIGVRTS